MTQQVTETQPFRITEKQWKDLVMDVTDIHECLLGTYEKQGLVSRVRNHTKLISAMSAFIVMLIGAMAKVVFF